MASIYRIIEHKDHPKRNETLSRSLGGEKRAQMYIKQEAETQRISEIYRGKIKPVVIGQCQNCVFWERGQNREGQSENYGTCNSESYIKGVRVAPEGIWTACGENTIETSEDFGCVSWRAIESVEPVEPARKEE